jgi:hypothetical protein
MKKLIAAIFGVALLTALSSSVLAEDAKTIKGEAVCAKCQLHESAKCQTAIQVKDGDKTTTYYAVNNDVAKAFHKNVCQGSAAVTATGTVEEKDGKQMITLTKIDADGK